MRLPVSYFISLKSTPDKTKKFLRVNEHVPGIKLFCGVDGTMLLEKQQLERNIADSTCRWTGASIGSGLSHALLWLKAAKEQTPLTIFENDAFLCENFEDEHQRILSDLPPDWDIILWGFNADTSLQFDMVPGLRICTANFDQSKVRRNINSFHKTRVEATAFPLIETLGICAYSISPKGAETFISQCLPFRTYKRFYKGLKRNLDTVAVDDLMNDVYPQSKSFVAFPPLCLPSNDSSPALTGLTRQDLIQGKV